MPKEIFGDLFNSNAGVRGRHRGEGGLLDLTLTTYEFRQRIRVSPTTVLGAPLAALDARAKRGMTRGLCL